MKLVFWFQQEMYKLKHQEAAKMVWANASTQFSSFLQLFDKRGDRPPPNLLGRKI
ncbi:hypothetical protein H6F88_09215 [Oculatella sp. FACHB-28]|uniref:hypothetical protein n=1 Tax=Cyanophyceae TaxID=3028117 RepID=UPI0016832B58|nr:MULTISPECIES: hypothetical protein [Cyanophyceae]MBD1995526.1 hypothetical protein [Leptolyngbya sp. FACHB-541]MBD2056193.1 hypothetical protein [Oculatella sp. FACHB-28]